MLGDSPAQVGHLFYAFLTVEAQQEASHNNPPAKSGSSPSQRIDGYIMERSGKRVQKGSLFFSRLGFFNS